MNVPKEIKITSWHVFATLILVIASLYLLGVSGSMNIMLSLIALVPIVFFGLYGFYFFFFPKKKDAAREPIYYKLLWSIILMSLILIGVYVADVFNYFGPLRYHYQPEIEEYSTGWPKSLATFDPADYYIRRFDARKYVVQFRSKKIGDMANFWIIPATKVDIDFFNDIHEEGNLNGDERKAYDLWRSERGIKYLGTQYTRFTKLTIDTESYPAYYAENISGRPEGPISIVTLLPINDEAQLIFYYNNGTSLESQEVFVTQFEKFLNELSNQ